jgi:hypothetical protein
VNDKPDPIQVVAEALKKYGTMGAAIEAGAIPMMFGVPEHSDTTDG